MTTKEKAHQIFDKYFDKKNYNKLSNNVIKQLFISQAKESALICAEEALKAGCMLVKYELEEDRLTEIHINWWQEVKKEISEI